MPSNIEQLGINLFKNIESTQSLWFKVFGPDFQSVWCDPEHAIKEVVDVARSTLAETSSIQQGAAHATLFMRDPLTDRLILEYSTRSELNRGEPSTPPSNLFKDKRMSYNEKSEYCYYDLCDSLSDEISKRNKTACETRGLTGWIAVTGIPLIVNSSRSQEMLDDMIKENDLAEQLCHKYGYPMWGHRISEFYPPDDQHGWSKRFVGVPIQSITSKNESRTIGIIRYSCPIKAKELSKLDLFFLQNIASLISILKNIQQVKVLCGRDAQFEKEELAFQQFGDFSKFLEFIAYSLRSRISSLYIMLETKNGNKLRLFDAYGISEYTGDCREQIFDYSNSKDQGGLTFEILELPQFEPKIFNSVVKSDNWRGCNTKLFYGKSLGELNISDHVAALDNPVKKRELLERHPIKLTGCSLHENDTPIGVLKVEFPKIYDDSQHYNDSDDIFLTKCAKLLTKELACYKNFISCDWFADATEAHINEYIRYMGQIYRYKLLKPEDEFDDFWKLSIEYAEEYTEEIQRANLLKIQEKPMSDVTRLITLKHLNEIDDADENWGWMKKTFISETIKNFVGTAIGFGGEAIKQYLNSTHQ